MTEVWCMETYVNDTAPTQSYEKQFRRIVIFYSLFHAHKITMRFFKILNVYIKHQVTWQCFRSFISICICVPIESNWKLCLLDSHWNNNRFALFMLNTYASTNGPGYGSDFWYKLDNFKLNIIAGKNSRMHVIIPAHKPFCNDKNWKEFINWS